MEITFQEIQYVPELAVTFVTGLLFHILLLCRRVPLSLNIAICALLFPMALLAFELKTVVDDEIIRVRLGRIPLIQIPLIQYSIPLNEVAGYKVITHVHVDDSFGVWRDEAAVPLSVSRGERALALELKNGSRYLIVSRRMKELQQAIEKGREKSGDGA